MQIINYFEVYDCYTMHGIGPQTVIARFSSLCDADKYAIGKGNYGRNALVREVNIIISNSIEEMESIKREDDVKAALKKLTFEERKLLGLS